jgi:DNA-binding transcriptional MerR regulator
MKISELVKRTNVPKETIHFYIRDGALPKPRKSSKNTADYGEDTVEQLQLIKELQDNYFLPLSEIKKILKKQRKLSDIDKIKFRFLTKSLRPIDQISLDSVYGKEKFMEITEMSEKWLDLMQEWQIITPEIKDEQPIYAPDDVIIAKLIVDMDRLGLGPRDGYDPENLKLYTNFVKDTVLPIHMSFLKEHFHLLKSPEFQEKGIKMIEAVGLFFYHIYRKIIKEEVLHVLDSMKNEDKTSGTVPR